MGQSKQQENKNGVDIFQRVMPQIKRGPGYYIPIIAGILLLLAVVIFLLVFGNRNTLVDGQIFSAQQTEYNLQNAGLSHVRGLAKCKNAQSINLQGNQIRTGEYDFLHKRLPDCDIHWDVPLAGAWVDSNSQQITLERIPSDWRNLKYFPNLTVLALLETPEVQKVGTLREYLPGVQIVYTIPFADSNYESTASELTFSGNNITYEELMSGLGAFPELTTVNLVGEQLTDDQKRSLKEVYPNLRFVWEIQAGDYTCLSSDTVVAFPSGVHVNVYDLGQRLDLFCETPTVDFTGSDVSVAIRLAFMNSYPETNATWHVTIHGVNYKWDVRTLNLEGVELGSATEVETAVPYLPYLEKVDLCDCGISNEEMAALNEKYTNVRFVWKVYFANYYLRTDATYFIASDWEDGERLYNGDLWVLQYCTDLEGLDLGHQRMTDLSFLYSMPHMKYLILAESPVADITPIGSLKELVYLEMFTTSVTDISPLLGCTALQDLNCSNIATTSDDAFAVLKQMTWLKRLWYVVNWLDADQKAELQACLPDCEIFMPTYGEPTGSTWRYGGLYYEMRDFFHMIYQPGGTNDVDEDGNQIILDDAGQQFILRDWDFRQDWWNQFTWYHPVIYGITC